MVVDAEHFYRLTVKIVYRVADDDGFKTDLRAEVIIVQTEQEGIEYGTLRRPFSYGEVGEKERGRFRRRAGLGVGLSFAFELYRYRAAAWVFNVRFDGQIIPFLRFFGNDLVVAYVFFRRFVKKYVAENAVVTEHILAF